MNTQDKPEILVVDDNSALRMGTVRLLRKQDYMVHEADCGLAALDMIQTCRPDLVVLDVNMPDISGMEVCRRIHDSQGPNRPYIVMLSSSQKTSKDQTQGLESGADGYIIRPIPNQELLARIDAFIRLKKSEERRRQLEKRLLQAMKYEAIATMAGGIAHDYNNLLSVIINGIELIEDELPPYGDAAETLSMVLDAGHLAAKLTTKFMALSFMSRPAKSACKPSDLLRAVIAKVSDQPDVEITLQTDPSNPIVFIDIDQVQQAIGFILENAFESMPAGGQITIDTHQVIIKDAVQINNTYIQSGRFVEIRISDTGIGICEEDITKIFDPYFSTKEVGTQKGMGLGLTTAMTLISRNGGYIDVRSEKKQGTSVSVFLPVAPEPTTVK